VFQRIDVVSCDYDNIVELELGAPWPLPPLEVPRIPDNLRPPSSNTGSGEFEVTYLDDDTRVTRGDRGELRVFVIA